MVLKNSSPTKWIKSQKGGEVRKELTKKECYLCRWKPQNKRRTIMGYPLNDGQKRLLSQILGQDEQKLEKGNYTLVFTSYSRARLDELLKHDDDRMQIRAAGRKEGSWARCPACDQPVLKEELLKKGCYLCGWRPQ